MFNDDKGSWFCMCLSSLWSLYAGCFIFNALEELCNPKAYVQWFRMCPGRPADRTPGAQ